LPIEPYPAQRLPGLPANTRQPWDGFFINLDRSPERRNRMQQQLSALGIADRYRRFPAIDGRTIKTSAPRSPGEVGIYRSHLNVLEKAAAAGRAVHIMEDDVILCDLTVPAIDAAIWNKVVDHYDILFLEVFVGLTVGNIHALHALYEKCTANHSIVIESPDQLQVIDLQDLYLYGATSYVVGPKNVDRVLSVLRRAWRLGPTVPLDTVIQQAARAKQLRVACFFPFVSTIDFDLSQASNAGRDELADNALAQRILRYSFYVRRDIKGRAAPAIAQVLERWNRPDPDGAIDLYMNVLRYHLSKP
jgi:GR25 family glycosyltransferase involved in LPS biosynthesis